MGSKGQLIERFEPLKPFEHIYSIVAITFNSIQIGVGKLFISTVVLQASTPLKYSP
jgi:hypothetical protein